MSTPNVSNSRNWLNLPDDVTAKILTNLGPVEILVTAQKVCPSWRRICKDSSMWRFVNIRNSGGENNESYMEDMCRYIVDCSDGQLIEITIECFGSDKLLEYIAHRSSGLKCLRLVRCLDIFDSGLIKAIEKLPLLEELELTYCDCLTTKKVLKEVGKSLCLLTSFKLNKYIYHEYEYEDYEDSCDDEALAIAENMPGLRHLQLVGNLLTDNGLLAILSGCPHLESLDLRGCDFLLLEGNLEKTCIDHVKSLKFPDAPIDDLPYDQYYDEENYLKSFEWEHGEEREHSDYSRW
ncbi:hypothetical protein ACFE04_031096 [Oxalis oulophora]